jgi:hypothetical protein
LIVAQTFGATEDTDVTGTIATRAGAGATVAVTVNPTRGTLTAFAGSGAFTYRPNPNANGTDTFTVEAVDSGNNRLTAVMTVSVAAVNDAPVASNDFIEVASAATITLPVRTNDSDADGETPTVVLTTPAPGQEANPAIGTASVSANGEIEVTLPANFRGVTRVRYRLRDAAGAESADVTAVGFVGTPRFTYWYTAPHGNFPQTLLVSDLVDVRQPFTFASAGDFGGAEMSASGNAVLFSEGYPAPRALWVVGTAGVQTPVRVTPEFTATQDMGEWELSPDGQWVAYLLFESGQPQVWLVPVANPAARVSVPLRPNVYAIDAPYFPIRFSANSGGLYFVTIDSTVSRHLIRAPVADPSHPVSLYPRENEGGDFFEYYIAPDESYVVTRYGDLIRVSVADPANRTVLNAPLAMQSLMNSSQADPTATRFIYQTTDYTNPQGWPDDEVWMVYVATPGVSTRVLDADPARTGPLGWLSFRPDRNALLFNPWMATVDGYHLELAELSLSPANGIPVMLSPGASGPPRVSTRGSYLDDDHILWVLMKDSQPWQLFETRRDAMGAPTELGEAGIMDLTAKTTADKSVLAFPHRRNTAPDPLVYGVLVNRAVPGTMLRVTPGVPYSGGFAIAVLGLVAQP